MRVRSIHLTLGLWLVSGVAYAAPTQATVQCIDGSERGQAARDAGDLLEARTQFLRCAQPQCPGAIQTACAEWGAAVGTQIPSFVLEVKDARGADVTTGSITLDGTPLPQDALEGRAVEVNPGSHVFRFEAPGSPAIERSIVAREGETKRLVSIALAPAPRVEVLPPPAPPPRSHKPPAVSWVLAGIGVAAIGTGAAFEVSGLVSRSNLDECSPRCSTDRVDEIRRRMLVGDIAIGVGVAAVAVGAVLWILDARAPSARSAWTGPFLTF